MTLVDSKVRADQSDRLKESLYDQRDRSNYCKKSMVIV